MTATATTEATEVTLADFALVTTTEPRLTNQDRCDSCGAQAYIEAVINGSALFYCAHHGRKYEEKLRALATHFHDETARLLEEGANRHKE